MTQKIQIRWADIDANRHLRHSVYYDYAASMRMALLVDRGLTTDKLETLQLGPILFREEATFRREIVLEDEISIDAELIRATDDYTRWSIRHNIIKADGTVAAVIVVDGAWIDMQKRKLAGPSEVIRTVFETFPRSKDFEPIIPAKKVV